MLCLSQSGHYSAVSSITDSFSLDTVPISEHDNVDQHSGYGESSSTCHYGFVSLNASCSSKPPITLPRSSSIVPQRHPRFSAPPELNLYSDPSHTSGINNNYDYHPLAVSYTSTAAHDPQFARHPSWLGGTPDEEMVGWQHRPEPPPKPAGYQQRGRQQQVISHFHEVEVGLREPQTHTQAELDVDTGAGAGAGSGSGFAGARAYQPGFRDTWHGHDGSDVSAIGRPHQAGTARYQRVMT
jgi:hypothetical protein